MLRERLLPCLLLLSLCFGATTASAAADWLHTSGNRFYTASGEVWVGVGANMHDTRSCNACTWGPPNVGEVKRRIDELVDNWGANFIRLDLESYGSSSILNDPAYLADVVEMVDHIGTKPGVYVLLSLWIDPSFTDMGWPTAATRDVWRKLATTFRNHSHVMYGLVNEPQHNYDGAHNSTVWNAMNDAVLAIRDVEDGFGTPRHIVAVQGVGGWSRFLGHYVNNPITAGGGENVAYEVHVYDPQSTFADRFENPSMTLPVIIGEYGPMHGMSMNDCSVLMQRSWQLKIPSLAWTFHMRCPPNLIVDNSNGGCGVGMQLTPTSWGSLLKNHLAQVKSQFVGMTHGSGGGSSGGGSSGGGSSGGGGTVDPPPATGSYDPGFSLGANNNEWWIEAYANADSVQLEREGGARVAMPRTDWGSFATNTNVATGSRIRLHFTRGSDGASSTWFRHLLETPALAPATQTPTPPPVDPVTPPDPVSPPDPVTPPSDPGAPAGQFNPELTVGSNVNEWWVEVYSNGDSVEVELEDGRVVALPATSWGSFATSVYVKTGTGVRFRLASGADSAVTSWFPWLNGEPTFQAPTPPSSTYDPNLRVSRRATEWWPAILADADTVVGQLESNGELFTFSKRKQTFVSNLRPLRKGTRIRLFLKKGTLAAQTPYFRFLVDTPTVP